MGCAEPLHEQLIRDVGIDRTPRRSESGQLLIGVAHDLETEGLSEHLARQILAEDIAKLTAEMLHEIPWAASLDQTRRNVLVYIAFVWGLHRLLGHYAKVPMLCELGLFERAGRAFYLRCDDLPESKKQRLLLLLELGADGGELALRAEALAERGIA